MKKKKKYREVQKKKYNDFQKNIANNTKFICLPKSSEISTENINIGTNVNVVKTNSDKKIITKNFKLKTDLLKNDPIKTTQYLLLPNRKQCKILQQWFNAYVDMYNCIIRKIKNKYIKELNKNKYLKLTDLTIDLSIGCLKKEFAQTKKILINKYSQINAHVLDYAMGDAVAMFKSKITNLKNGHIKKSRLRFIKRTRSNKILKIEKYLCTDKSFCSSQIGKKMKTLPEINFKQRITTVAIIKYDSKKDKYYLYVRDQITNENNSNDIIKMHEDGIKICDDIIETSKEYEKLIIQIKKDNSNVQIKLVDTINKANKRFKLNAHKDITDQLNATSKKYNELIHKIKNSEMVDTIHILNISYMKYNDNLIKETSEQYKNLLIKIRKLTDECVKKENDMNRQLLETTDQYNNLMKIIPNKFNKMINNPIILKNNYLSNRITKSSKMYIKFIEMIKSPISLKIKNVNKESDLMKRKIKNTIKRENKKSYKQINQKKKDVISIDPGVRVFATGLSNNHLIEFGKNLSSIIRNKLKFIDNINNNETISADNKKRLVGRTYDRIQKKMKDCHWKIINYLTSNYSHIIIGNFSTKRMSEGKINPMTKRIGNMLQMYTFKERLKYKCFLKGVKYHEEDEYCTSICCSSCGNCKKDLGPNKIYNCNKCKIIIDRDVNASKNILMKSII